MNVFDRWRDRAIERVKGVSDSVERAFRKTTLRSQISQREDAVQEALAAVGRIVLTQVEVGAPAPPGSQEYVSAIRRDQLLLIALRAELEALEAADRPAADTCRACGAPLEPGQRFCMRCGHPLPAASVAALPPTARCPSCAAPTTPAQKFCAQCGQAVASTEGGPEAG